MPQDLQTYLVARQLSQAANRYGDREAVKYQTGGKWCSLGWQQLNQQSDALGAALLNLDTAEQDRIGIFAGNSLNWLMTDIACIKTRAVLVPIYGTSTLEQARYIVNDAQVKVLFVGEQSQYDIALDLVGECPSLTTVVLMDSGIQQKESTLTQLSIDDLKQTDAAPHQAELEKRQQQIQLDDLFTLIYTSGTTGEPKGVMLVHRNIASLIDQHRQAVPIDENILSLSFLPLSHIYERAWSLYVLSQGGRVAYLNDPTLVQKALVELKPEVMCAVPRLFEKIHSTIISKVTKASLTKRALFAWSLRQGRRQYQADIIGRTRAEISKLMFSVADKLVLSKMRDALGGNLKFVSAGGARLDDQVNGFFQHIGIPLLNGYGATETTATVTCNRVDSRRTSGVGLPLPGIQVRIGADDEILVKGDTVMAGYYNRPADTNQAFEDGWYKTGDAGYIDDDGHLHITDRIKELMKTSNGKYIAPQRVEGQLALDPFIEQAAIIADGRNFVSALVVADFAQLGEWAKEQNLSFNSDAELVALPEVLEMMQARVKENQAELARFEQVKQITLMPRPFSMDHGELTPTLKLRRKVISEVFKSKIDEMYQRRH
ncbi:AMP-dependent synthetase/ligase [Ferrimonas aestuarii]|uniref:Long-chain fatty acid--CoA ligase n=1 Tax=Ferrimonas aestuarii TaxID=2569539 RepID=A0A4U1BSG4_9GAMM|nr:long-chain fatty acid--CoA ligase [Ferrimonas aestuarii]TKB58346.1 long-chain fatty acid--CoA ligase [Ferrimonas aestuarii]